MSFEISNSLLKTEKSQFFSNSIAVSEWSCGVCVSDYFVVNVFRGSCICFLSVKKICFKTLAICQFRFCQVLLGVRNMLFGVLLRVPLPKGSHIVVLLISNSNLFWLLPPLRLTVKYL